MAAIYATLFWCALQVTLFLTLAAPIYLLVRRRSPHAATFAAASSLGAVILLSALAASPWPRWSLSTAEGERVPRAGGSPTATDVGRDQAMLSSTSANVASGGDAEPSATSPLAALWEAVQFAATAPTSTTTPGPPADESVLHWSTVVVALFLAGMLGSAAHLAAGLVAVRHLIAGSRPLEETALVAELASLRQRLNIIRPVLLHESTEVATPATIGWRRPAILLPPAWRTWSDVELRAVLAHELAHIAQHDFAAWLVARAAVVVHFYHPLVRWFASRLQLDQELAADAAAVRLLGDRDSYLRALASLALATPAHRLPSHVNTFIPSRSLLVRRVEMLRTAETGPGRLSRVVHLARAACLGSLIVVAAAVAGIRPPTAPAAETEVASAPQHLSATVNSAALTPAVTAVSGSVVDAMGAPVPQALVVCHRDAFHGGDVEAVADEQGKFSLKLAHPIGRMEMLDTWAYAKGHAIRTVSPRALGVDATSIENVVITLPPPERIEFKVNLPSIDPAVGVRVAPRLFEIPNGVYSADESTGLSTWVPERLADVLSEPVGADGMVSFDALPRKLVESFRIEMPEYGIQEFSDFEDEIRLAPAGRVEGRIETSTPQELAGTVLYLESGPTRRQAPVLTRKGLSRVVIDDSGRFVAPAVMEGELRVSIDWPKGHSTRPVLVTERPRVDAGSTLQLVIREVPAIVVKGRVVAGEERRPVDGAMISIRNAQGIEVGADVESDANGEFEAKMAAGKITVQVYVHGKVVGDDRQFDYPQMKHIEIPESVEEFPLDEIVLQPKAILAGKLLRSNGSPSVGVAIGLRRGHGFRHLAAMATTDADGMFRMPVADWKLTEERLPDVTNEWLLISQPDSPQETPTRTPLKVVSEEPLVLQER